MTGPIDVECVLAAGAELAESPVWDGDTGRLLWVDIPRSQVHAFEPATGNDVVLLRGRAPVGFVAHRRVGGLVVGCGTELLGLDEAGRTELLAALQARDPSLRFNDAGADLEGRLWAGTVTADHRPGSGDLWVVTGRDLHRAVAGTTIANGLGWSPDGSILYFVDSPLRTVDCFAVDGDLPFARRSLVRIEPGVGVPDGLCVDREGALWVALYGGGAVRRYSPAGELLTEVLLPARNVTSCAFGGPRLEELYITTAAGPGVSGAGGSLFRCRPGVDGLPAAAAAI